MPNVNVFLSWSGNLSREVATILKSWLPDILRTVDPWISNDHIGKGKPWFETIVEQLGKSPIGIIVVTAENVASNWIHFEAGAIYLAAKGAPVCSYLIDVGHSALKGSPLGQLQLTLADKDDTWRLVRDINKLLEVPHDEKLLKNTFDKKWPSLQKKLEKLKETYSSATVVPPTPKDPDPIPPMDDNDAFTLLQGWFGNLSDGDSYKPMKFAEVDMAAGVPAGTAKRMLVHVARRYNMVTDSEGPTVIKFKEFIPDDAPTIIQRPW